MYSDQSRNERRSSMAGLRKMKSKLFGSTTSQSSQPPFEPYNPYQQQNHHLSISYQANSYQPSPSQQQWQSNRPLPNRGVRSFNRGGPPSMPPNPLQPQVNPVHIPAPAARQLHKPTRSQPSNTNTPQQKVHFTPLTATQIRELRDLIRYRYALDVEISTIGKRVKYYQRQPVLAKMAQADAALVAIKMRLDAWDKIEYFESKDAYMRFREVKSRILGANIKNWEREPPWKEREKVGVEVGVHEVDGRGVVGVARVYRA